MNVVNVVNVFIGCPGNEVDGRDIALPNAPYPMKGVGPFLHIDPHDRQPAIFATRNTLHFAEDQRPYLLLPIIPER